MSDHGRIEERIAAYALDASDPEDRETHRELLDHLAGCASCQALYRDMRESAGELALAASPRAISAALSERVMSAVRGEPRAREASARRPARIPRLLVAAALAVVAVLGAFNVRLVNRLNDERAEVRRAQVALSILSDPTTRHASLSERGGDGVVTVAMARDGRAVLVGEDLTVPNDRVLEIWLLRGTDLVPSEVFRPSGGSAIVTFEMDPARDRGIAITLERGPVTEPTAAPIFAGELRA